MANATLFLPLSESPFGAGVLIAQTVTPGTLVHESAANVTDVHQVWIEAYNSHTSAVEVSVEFGSDTALPMRYTVPSRQGLWLLVDGQPLVGDTGTAKTVRVFAGTTNVVKIFGKHFAITP